MTVTNLSEYGQMAAAYYNWHDMTVTNLLDYALPFSAEDRRCGMKKKAKTEKRLKLASLLNDLRNGKDVDLRQVNILVDYNTFEQRVNEWIGSLMTS